MAVILRSLTAHVGHPNVSRSLRPTSCEVGARWLSRDTTLIAPGPSMRKSPSLAVLVAATADGLKPLRRSLAGRAALLPVYEMNAVGVMLDEPIDIVLCSIHFDQSRMFELIRLVKSRRPDLPVVCCCILHTQLSEEGLRSMAVAARQIGAADIIDLRSLGSDPVAGGERLAAQLARIADRRGRSGPSERTSSARREQH